MDGACDKVDELKAEIEKLREECHTKRELSESLKKANSELLLESKEAKTLIEQRSKELEAKTVELSEQRQICENLKSSLEEKDSSSKHLNFVNEKLKVEYTEKVRMLEDQNNGLVVALDEATVKIQDLNRKVCASGEEIQGLKKLLSIAEKKCNEAEEKSKALKELKCRDDIILEVEEENRSVKDQLKWKSEQFEHLEEAHELLQNQFHLGKVEWEREKSDLLKDLYSLKTSLDSQMGISEQLRCQLKICNQALSREESKRKILEIEVVELRSHFDNVVSEFEEAKLKIENLTLLRDEDIADLRSELGSKEALNKEMKYRISHLELENEELLGLLKECREQQIKLASGVSLKKLQNKLKSLEQLHGQCSVNLKKKEAEWNSRYEKMMEVVNGNISDLKIKDVEIQELQKRLEYCSYLMEFQNESEKVMRSEVAKMGLVNKECDRLGEEKSAGRRMNYVRQTGISEEISICQVKLKEHFEQMETTSRTSCDEIVYTLEIAHGKLDKKINEVNQTTLELQKWKSSADLAKSHLEENQEILKREKDSLVDLVKERDEKICNLQNQVVLLDANMAAAMEDTKTLEQEKKHYYRVVENNDFKIKELRSEIALLKQESAERESAIQESLDAEITNYQEKGRLLKVIMEKDQSNEDLRRWIMLIEQDYESELLCSFSAITEKQTHLDLLIESMENTEKLKQLEIQDKNKAIRELEKGKQDLCHELEVQKLEIEEVKKQGLSKQAQVIALQRERESLLEEKINMYSQRENMIAKMEAVYDWISDLSSRDVELTSGLEKILQSTDNNIGQVINLICDEHGETRFSPSTKNVKEISNQRLPLKELKN